MNIRPLLLAFCWIVGMASVHGEDGYRLWLRYGKVEDAAKLEGYRELARQVVVQGKSPTLNAAREELLLGLNGLLANKVEAADSVSEAGAVIAGTPQQSPVIKSLNLEADLKKLGREGYVIRSVKVSNRAATVIASQGDVGVLYGAFHFLRLIQTQKPCTELNIAEAPKIQRRMLSHWDNLDGTIERGYAGRSLWQWADLPDKIDPRYKDYARACASLGINGATINNVNTSADYLEASYLKKIAALADVLRPYGITVYLCPRFSAPKEIGALPNCDPLDPAVKEWWKKKADEIYALIPDFGGFQVKANCEGQPGPKDYKRSHAEGAVPLAEAVAPHGGIVMWRAFIYGNIPMRPMEAYKTFKPLDGLFPANALVQIKNGPVDFQPREPFSPLFGAMTKTPCMAELQITQEYLGFSNHLVYRGVEWEEFLKSDTFAKGPGSTVGKVLDGSLLNYSMTAITGVANTGSDRNWCGHHFAQANWYAFGRLAWNPEQSAEAIADDWVRMTWSNDPQILTTCKGMLMGSREAFVSYNSPLGNTFHSERGHYAPDPGFRTLYTGVTMDGLGVDRTSKTMNAVGQYFSPLREQLDDPVKIDEKLLLWFHHVPWDFKMKSGRTFWEEFCGKFTAGMQWTREAQAEWRSLKGKVDDERYEAVDQRLSIQVAEAAKWRDYVLRYYHQYSGLPLPADVPEQGPVGLIKK